MAHSEKRRALLHEYLLEVTRDLLVRGVIRKRAGQTIAQVLDAELGTVISDIGNDLKNIGGEMFGGALGGFFRGLFNSPRRG